MLADNDDATENEMRESCLLLDAWAAMLSGALGDDADMQTRWGYSSLNMFNAVLAAIKFKSGAKHLKKYLSQAITLTAPPMLVGALQKRLAEPDGVGIIPSASLIRFNELALDLSLSALRQRQYKRSAVRMLWSDSSLQLGFDLLWVQCHEVERDQVVNVFKAVADLTVLVRMWAQERARILQDGGEHDDLCPESWIPLLKTIGNSIKEHIFTPGVMASGHRGLVHKVVLCAIMVVFCIIMFGLIVALLMQMCECLVEKT